MSTTSSSQEAVIAALVPSISSNDVKPEESITQGEAAAGKETDEKAEDPQGGEPQPAPPPPPAAAAATSPVSTTMADATSLGQGGAIGGSSASSEVQGGGGTTAADSRQEARELKILLEEAKATINELNGILVRYEEENSRLRTYMEGITKQQEMSAQSKIDGPGTQSEGVFDGGGAKIGLSTPFPSRGGSTDYSSGSERSSICSEAVSNESKKRPRAESEGGGRNAMNEMASMLQVTRPSVPPPSLPGPKNYRKSCDFCTATKIRCDGGKPTCENCAKRSLNCHYSERKRPGPKINSAFSSSSSSLNDPPRWVGGGGGSSISGNPQSSIHPSVTFPGPGGNYPPCMPPNPNFPFPSGGGGVGVLPSSQQQQGGVHFTDHVEAAATLCAMPNLRFKIGEGGSYPSSSAPPRRSL